MLKGKCDVKSSGKHKMWKENENENENEETAVAEANEKYEFSEKTGIKIHWTMNADFVI